MSTHNKKKVVSRSTPKKNKHISKEKESNNTVIPTTKVDIGARESLHYTFPKIDYKEWNKHIKTEIKSEELIEISSDELLILLSMPVSFQGSKAFERLTTKVLKSYPKTKEFPNFNLVLKTAIETYLRQDILYYDNVIYIRKEGRRIIKTNWNKTLFSKRNVSKQIILLFAFIGKQTSYSHLFD